MTATKPENFSEDVFLLIFQNESTASPRIPTWQQVQKPLPTQRPGPTTVSSGGNVTEPAKVPHTKSSARTEKLEKFN